VGASERERVKTRSPPRPVDDYRSDARAPRTAGPARPPIGRARVRWVEPRWPRGAHDPVGLPAASVTPWSHSAFNNPLRIPRPTDQPTVDARARSRVKYYITITTITVCDFLVIFCFLFYIFVRFKFSTRIFASDV